LHGVCDVIALRPKMNVILAQSIVQIFYKKYTKASFRLKKMNPMNSTTFILFGKYCPIVDQLGSKNSSRDFFN
jgi:hypothetical protein